MAFRELFSVPLQRLLPLHGRGRGREVEGAGEGAEGLSTSVF